MNAHSGARKGRLISLEGADGVGKSTQADHLAQALRQAGHEVVQTREPGGCPQAEQLRALLVTGGPGHWSATSEALMMTAARVEHTDRVIRPALARGAWVVTDRYVHSTFVYQGLAGGLSVSWLRALHRQAVGGLMPDLALVLTLPLDQAVTRLTGRADAERRFEAKGPGFQDKVRHGFLELAQSGDDPCRVIDADGTPGRIAERIWAAVTAAFPDATA